MKRFAAIMLCFAIFFYLPACGQKAPKNANKSFTYQVAAEPKTLDPQVAEGSASSVVIEALFEGLTRLDETNRPYPGVAESWESNASNTQFTFHLRSDAKWDDKKTPVTANDFVFAFQRALLPEMNAPGSSSLYCIKNAKAIHEGNLPASKLGAYAKDSQTLVVDLAYPYEEFPALTATSVFMPCNEAFFKETAGRYGLERKYLLGNGPFVIDGPYGWEHGKHINLKRSASYKGANAPLPSSLTFYFGDGEVDLSSPLKALLNKDVDAVPLPAGNAEQAKKEGCTLTSFQDTTWGLGFNVAQQAELNPLQNLQIRKAFLQSIDRKKLLQHLPAGMQEAPDIITPSTTLFGKSYRSSSGSNFYLKQDSAARSTMQNGLNAVGLTEMPAVTVLCPNTTDAKLLATDLISTWNTVFDAYFNMEPVDTDTLTSRVASGNYQIALYALYPTADGPSNVLTKFKSTARNNPAGLHSSEFDTLLETAEQADSTSAPAAYAAAERYLNEQAIFYPLFYESRYYAAAPGVTGIVFHPYNAGADFIQAGKDS